MLISAVRARRDAVIIAQSVHLGPSPRTLLPSASQRRIGAFSAVPRCNPRPSQVQASVSQINGCAYCVDLHVRDLRKAGEAWQRINSLATWREDGTYEPREQAALNWAKNLTRLADENGGTARRDAAFAQLHAHFTDTEIVDLTVRVVQINARNRMGVGTRLPVAVRPMD